MPLKTGWENKEFMLLFQSIPHHNWVTKWTVKKGNWGICMSPAAEQEWWNHVLSVPCAPTSASDMAERGRRLLNVSDLPSSLPPLSSDLGDYLRRCNEPWGCSQIWPNSTRQGPGSTTPKMLCIWLASEITRRNQKECFGSFPKTDLYIHVLSLDDLMTTSHWTCEHTPQQSTFSLRWCRSSNYGSRKVEDTTHAMHHLMLLKSWWTWMNEPAQIRTFLVKSSLCSNMLATFFFSSAASN